MRVGDHCGRSPGRVGRAARDQAFEFRPTRQQGRVLTAQHRVLVTHGHVLAAQGHKERGDTVTQHLRSMLHNRNSSGSPVTTTDDRSHRLNSYTRHAEDLTSYLLLS